MKKVIIILIIIVCQTQTFAQTTFDAESIFKMHLFLDKPLAKYRGMDSKIIKNDSLYSIYSDLIELKIDTLQIHLKGWSKVLLPEYVFYQLNAKDNVRYKRLLKNKEDQLYGIFTGHTTRYVIGVHKKSGLSYRMYGFSGNDFLSFLSDFKSLYKGQIGEKLSTRVFLKRYHVETLDFSCLYKGLRAEKIDPIKYPCLRKANDPIIVK